MRPTHPRSFRAHATHLRRQFLQGCGLPFTDILTEGVLADALAAVGRWLDRIYSPLVTLWVFLGQVLDPDHSCRAAVARLNAHRVANGRRPCSARTGAYCRARQRLPEAFFSAAACAVGRRLDARAEREWLWKGRRVYLFDGTTVSLPDTPANQAAYPQVHNQGPGQGFPIARLGALISLACGAVVNLGFCRYAGKGQGEVSLLRRLWGVLARGDVLLADRLTANWANVVFLRERGLELVSRLNKAHRRADFRRGRRLGRAQPGFRTRSVVVVTTLLDPRQATREDLAELYRARWHAELDLRSIKSGMRMRELRGKTPEMARKEVWAHVLAYNLVRMVMAQAAAGHGLVPRSVSFTGAMQTLAAFRPLLELRPTAGVADRVRLYRDLLGAIAVHRVGERPDRYEPRVKKRRRNHYGWLTRPRAEMKREMAKRGPEK